MSRKIDPESAFEYYVTLGLGRSYPLVAKRFKVHKRTITRLAKDGNWSDRLAKAEAEAREATDRRAVDALTEMNQRHLKIAKALQGKALEALRTMPLDRG